MSKKVSKQFSAESVRKDSSLFFKPLIQPKLTVNQPGDQYEQQADEAAEKVMQIKEKDHSFFSPEKPGNTFVQRKCAQCEEEKKEQLQMKGDGIGTDQDVPPIVHEVIGSAGQPLDVGTRMFMESRFGYDFSSVKIHTNEDAAKSAQAVNALAYTSGNSIVFNSNQYNTNTTEGKKLLAHELTHVIQQGEGDVSSAVQKNVGDEHDLQSENFKGDIVLEGCFDGEIPHFLKIGKKGEPVRKLQTALLQLGFELPQFGADGIFMSETDRAVRSFQREHKLAVDGIVGPESIGTMDAMLPGSAPVPPEPFPFPPDPPQPAPSCPLPSQDTILQTKLKPVKKQVVNHVQQKTIQRKHLTMRESMDEFSKKVNSSVSTDPLVTSKGQFYWSQLAGQLIADDMSKAFSPINPITAKAVDLAVAITNDDAKKIASLMKEIPQDIEKSGVANAADLVKMFLPVVADDPVILWGKFDKEGHVPSDFAKKHKNFNAFMQLRIAERTACFSVAEFIRKRFQKEGGFTGLDSSKKGKTKPSVSGTPFTGATRNFEWIGSRTKGDVVNYNSSSLSSLITKIRAAIDDGFTIHVRVVSGVNFGLGLNPRIKAAKGVSPVPKSESVTGNEEHSIVIIGFDDVSDEFLFWDPDSRQSNFNGRVGFGILHFNSNRLTTAKDTSDLLVNEDGAHSSGNKRYQVLRVFI